MKLTCLKAAILYGVVIGFFLSALLVIRTIIDGRSFVLLALAIGIFAGLMGSIIFGIAMTLFVKWQILIFTKVRDEYANEYDIIYDSAANYLIKGEGEGGWLFLTSDNLFFKSHNFNIQNHELTIRLRTIKSITACTFLFIFRTGLIIKMVDNEVEEFSVDNPQKWIEEIEKLVIKEV